VCWRKTEPMAKILIKNSADSKKVEYLVDGELTDILRLLLTSMKNKPGFAATLFLAVEMFVNEYDQKDNLLVKVFMEQTYNKWSHLLDKRN
jgi:hypothetical protein